ncbi:MAG: hypothetical protein ABI648_10070 [Betaproteobacteria bacterium]
MQDSPKPAPEPPQDAGADIDLLVEIRPWWQRSPPLAAGASLAIGLATLWFANMLGRVPLDSHSTLGYLLMLPLLLIVPAFSAAGLRLAWLAMRSGAQPRWLIATIALGATLANGLAITGFVASLARIFSL